MSIDNYKTFRKNVVHLILSTDNAKHFQLLIDAEQITQKIEFDRADKTYL